MKFSVFFIIGLFSVFQAYTKGIKPEGLNCENLKDPMVIDVDRPRLSWINANPDQTRGQVQTAWNIRVASSGENLDNNKPDLWDSGKISSDQSVNIIYNGKPLHSRQDCWWQVRVWDKDGNVSEWSDKAFWSMGLLGDNDWKAEWIGVPWQNESPIPDNERPLTMSRAKPGQSISDIYALKVPPPAPMLRKSFFVGKEVISARAYVTGLGYFEFYLNGEKVGKDIFVPNQTNYGKRPGLINAGIPVEDNFREYKVLYLAYDLTDRIKKGENVIGAMLGNGFYNAPINWTESYGTPRFIGQICIRYSDGTEDVIVSDESWKVAAGPVIMDLVYDGEHYDARKEQPGWCSPGFNDSGWENAVLRKAPEGRLRAQMSNPDRVMEVIKPVSIERTGEGKYKVDFGQEISGWVHLYGINGEAGRRIDIRYLHKTPVGDNSYTLRGGGEESYAARFTWFVFRQIEIDGWPGDLKAENLSAEAVYTCVEPAGKFECSSQLFNDINRIWLRSQKDNMHGGIASDCPNRERSPYTGDGQVACVTVMHNFDVRAFYTKWIQDILGAQNVNTGYVPNGAPWQPGCGGGVAWGAAMIIMPWEYYLHYGDTNMLRNNFEGMKGYIRYMLTWTDEAGIMYSQALGPNGKPNKWMNLGEWSQPYKLPPDEMVHTFYLWRCADLAASSAKVLGMKQDYDDLSALAQRTREAFQKRFYDEKKGTYGPFGGNIFALKIGLPGNQKEKVIAALKADIESNDGHLDTGIFGTQFFFETLSENGLHDLAYEAMNKRTAPGYGWWIEQGSTTSWEGWTDPGSGNHPMFGGGLVWFYRKLAGLNADAENPGYRHIIMKPQPAGDVTSCTYSTFTPYGTSSISWRKSAVGFNMEIIIPVGSTATVYIPGSNKNVKENGRKVRSSDKITYSGSEEGYSKYEVGSGFYSFSAKP